MAVTKAEVGYSYLNFCSNCWFKCMPSQEHFKILLSYFLTN